MGQERERFSDYFNSIRFLSVFYQWRTPMHTPPPATIWRAGFPSSKPICPVGTGPRWVSQRLTGRSRWAGSQPPHYSERYDLR